ncbi:hypothetical protein LTSEGIV_5165 [Salmonella enterica subsp. enterica serovar Give str. S5-487]|nr:hypothetical protein LTSEGIV_5165 [Salmonella enterica subsp. enterica serovar Give str. S5-487]
MNRKTKTPRKNVYRKTKTPRKRKNVAFSGKDQVMSASSSRKSRH